MAEKLHNILKLLVKETRQKMASLHMMVGSLVPTNSEIEWDIYL